MNISKRRAYILYNGVVIIVSNTRMPRFSPFNCEEPQYFSRATDNQGWLLKSMCTEEVFNASSCAQVYTTTDNVAVPTG